jgi:hypothetical protein
MEIGRLRENGSEWFARSTAEVVHLDENNVRPQKTEKGEDKDILCIPYTCHLLGRIDHGTHEADSSRRTWWLICGDRERLRFVLWTIGVFLQEKSCRKWSRAGVVTGKAGMDCSTGGT